MSTPNISWKTFLLAVGVGLSVFQVWSVIFSTMDPLLQRCIFLTWILAYSFLGYRPYRSKFQEGPGMLSIAGALLATVAGGYYAWNFDHILYHWPMIDELSPWALILGIVLFLLVLEATRKSVGMPIVVIAAFFSLYVLAGHWLPGSFSHRYLSLPEFIDQMVYTINGIFGTPLAVAATYVYMFVLFGVVLFHSGGGEFFIGVAKSVAGGARGGAAKVSVVACGLFGMITGSPTSDTVTTGSFAIPLMRRMKYSAVDAGAITAVAATGGSIMPPVMGSAAFIMAEFTGIPYVRIAIAGALPALLYFLGIMAQVHFQAVRSNREAIRDEAAPPFKELLARNFQFLVPIFALIALLAMDRTPTRAAGMATALTVVVSWVRPETRMGWRKILMALEETAQAAIIVVGATASAGILVGAIGVTGLGGKFTNLLFQLSGENLFPVLLVTMFVCVILGMGMPVPSAYILTAVVAAPALIRLGVPTMQAHLFIVYYAVMSAITPPVAVAAFAAAGIAGANPNEIGWRAVRYGIVAFIVPFIFVYQPELLLRGTFFNVALAFATSVGGVILLAAALEGWLFTRAVIWERLLLGGGGLLLIVPGLYSDLIGIAVLGVITMRQWPQRARSAAAAEFDSTPDR